MKSNFIPRFCYLCGVTAMCIAKLSAQSSLWFSSVNYESSALVAPVLIFYRPLETEEAISLGILGWTMSGSWNKPIDGSLSYGISAELTPLNSHSSNTVFRNGKEDYSLIYKNRTAQIRINLSMKYSNNWKSELAWLGLYESVGNLPDKNVNAFWNNPFAGIEVQEHYTSAISDDPMLFRFDGIRCSWKMQLFGGTAPWWKSEITANAGKKIGKCFLRLNGAYLIGNSLNVVNQFLIGGSWDILTSTALYGYHYAEFRLNKALLINGGIDVTVVETVEIGFHVGHLNSPLKNTYGECLKISSVWHGINLNAGFSFPEDEIFRMAGNKVNIFAGLTAAVFTQ